MKQTTSDNASQHKTAILNTRIEPKLKQDAERVLHRLGLSNAEAIRLFYTQICLNQGLPFDIKLPNKRTLEALKEAEARDTKKADSIDDLIDGS